MIEVYQADYQNADHRLSILELIDLYARDKMAKGAPSAERFMKGWWMTSCVARGFAFILPQISKK